MPHFVTLFRYTQQGIAKIKESPKRLDAAKKAAEKAGGKVVGLLLKYKDMAERVGFEPASKRRMKNLAAHGQRYKFT